MQIVRRIIGFWIDFIIGDAWEVAAVLGVVILVIAYIGDKWGGRQGLGFVLVATVIGVTWLALLRTTANARRTPPSTVPAAAQAEMPASADH